MGLLNAATQIGNIVSTHDASGTSVPESKTPTRLYAQLDLEIMSDKGISRTAKALYGRLLFFAGKDGRCNPSHETLAAQLGVGDRQIRNLLRELRNVGLISWRRTRSSASYEINPPEAAFTPDRKLTSGLDRKSISCEIGNALPIKRGLKRSCLKDVDIGCSSSTNASLPPSNPKQYPQLKDTLSRYMSPNPKKPSTAYAPTDRQIVDIVHAAAGEDESKICELLVYLYNERGLRPGTENGPKHAGWFKAVVQNYFEDRHDRDDARPIGHEKWEYRNETRLANRGY